MRLRFQRGREGHRLLTGKQTLVTSRRGECGQEGCSGGRTFKQDPKDETEPDMNELDLQA